MITSLQKSGNIQGLSLPEAILKSIHWNNEDFHIEVTQDEKIIIEKVKSKERKNIQQLFEDFEGEYEVEEINWGEPVGKEIW